MESWSDTGRAEGGSWRCSARIGGDVSSEQLFGLREQARRRDEDESGIASAQNERCPTSAGRNENTRCPMRGVGASFSRPIDTFHRRSSCLDDSPRPSAGSGLRHSTAVEGRPIWAARRRSGQELGGSRRAAAVGDDDVMGNGESRRSCRSRGRRGASSSVGMTTDRSVVSSGRASGSGSGGRA